MLAVGTGQQPAPDGADGGTALVLRSDTTHLVDMGTGNFGGDHDSLHMVVFGAGATSPTSWNSTAQTLATQTN